MPSEIDPLLPQSSPAPEISGHGYSTPKNSNTQELIYNDKEGYQGLNGDDSAQWNNQNGVEYGSEGGKSSPFYSNGQDDEDDKRSTYSTENAALKQITSLFTFVVGIALIVALISNGFGFTGRTDRDPIPIPGHPNPALSISERATKILEETPLFDGHDDLAIFLRMMYRNKIQGKEFNSKFDKGGLEGHVDVPRLKKGMNGGAFWSAFVTCPTNASWDFTDATYATAVSQTLSQIDLVRRLQGQYPGVFSPATAPLSDSLAAFHANRTLLGPLSIEGLHQLSPTAPLSSLRLYYTLGVRAATLTWNCHNVAADAAIITDADPKTGKFGSVVAPNYRNGITPIGRKIIKEMNRLGMLVDLSHTSYWTQMSVLSGDVSRAPVIYTHSSAFSVCPHPRNVHDDALQLVKKTNSLVMVNFNPDFISCIKPNDPLEFPTFYEKNNTIQHVAEHIMYIGNLIGYEHVGFGSDFDGIESTPTGLEDVAHYPYLVETLLKSNVSDADVAKVVGGNLVRVWQAAEKVSQQMKDEGILEEEDDVPELKY